MSYRIGTGYDVHALQKGLPLVIGGVKIKHDYGLVGHSDADVLLHAICDALLGSLTLGDIGLHFPDTSTEFKDIDSKILLKKTYDLVLQNGFRLSNLDATLIMEKPKVKDYIQDMRKQIAQILETSIKNISVKATTTERLGFTGREEGIAAEAVVLVESFTE